ncbi:putative sodium-coupled neutral amino acid transporter 10 isoform X42 [Eriocheir sinensis]|uniref:putative sodium-coupled neutral amino acid transporter 10 isoform X41 n=1 Tax=Eriocheir sinensis TaxID=95602 RepID=UPI0021C72EC9|nr:putative sodium-coupled neutral amino acid transporter 10 isoform X41 [Eriocheir sinensis]XP_050731946.1 putative sodium-coupled neutral amino acid transporter 10 isoform X42 [Eriocheir sinensis]
MAGNTRHVVNMANSIVGVSILSMPYCFKEAGLLLGVVMVLVSGVITKKTCMFLVRAAIMARHRSYEFLAFHVFGVRGKLAVELCMILFLIGICISFHVVMGDLAPAIAARLLHVPNTPSLRATMLLGIAILVVLPLCLLRKLDNLASMSAFSILFYFFLITVIFWYAFPRLVDGSWFHLAHLWRPAGVLQVLPICMLGLSCQSNVFEIYDSVPDPDVPKMRAVVNNALNLCCALYIAVGFFGYIAFVDQDIAGNLIMNFPASPLTEGIKLFFTVSLAISFPLMIFPCRTSIHSLVYRRIEGVGVGCGDLSSENAQGFDLVGNYMPEARFKAITVGILTVSVVVGILVPNIEFVLGVLGSTMGVIISLVLPSIMFIKVNSKASVERLVAQGIMLMGVLLIVTGTYLNLTHTPHDTALSAADQQVVMAVPPALLNDGLRDLPPEKEGDIPLPRRDEDARAKAGAGAGAGAEDSDTRREPVAPEPPPSEEEEEEKKEAAAAKQERKESVKEEGGGGQDPQGDALHPDAIQKEEKEAHQEGGGGAGLMEEELLQKIEDQHREQQKILAEQKQILQELKDQKAQQEQAAAAAAAAAVAAGNPVQPAAAAPQPAWVAGAPPAAAVPLAGQQAPNAMPVAGQQAVPAVPAVNYAEQVAPQAVIPAGQAVPLAPAAQVVPAGVPAAQVAQAVPAGQVVQTVPAGQVAQAVPVAQVAQAGLPAAQLPPNAAQVAPVANYAVLPAGQGSPALPAGQGAPAAQMAPAARQVPTAQVLPATSQVAPAVGQMGPAVPAALVGPTVGQVVPPAAPMARAVGPTPPAAAPRVSAGAPAGGQVRPATPKAPKAPKQSAPVALKAPKQSAPVAPNAPKPSSPKPRLPHYPSAGLPAGQQPAKKGPVGYLEKMSSAAPKKPRKHDEERRKRAAGPEPELVLGLGPEGADLPPVDLAAGGWGVVGQKEAAFETRHLLWGNRRTKRRHRRGGQRGGDEEYWDET